MMRIKLFPFKKLLLFSITVIMIVGLLACASTPPSIPTPTPTSAPTQTLTPTPKPPSTQSPTPAPTTTPTPVPTPTPTPTDGVYNPIIDPANFVLEINNPYFPLRPGTTFIYEGIADGEIERNEVYVTNETKEILSVICTVVKDTVWDEDDELVEETYDWYAQDKGGNVWYFGEDSKEYEDGDVVSTAGSWESGVDYAKPGIIMQATPKVGDSYYQEYYEGEAEDMAEVVSLGESVSVPYGSFSDCLKTKEWTPLEPGVVANKYYAPGIGFVLEIVVEGGSERVELSEIIYP